MCDLLLLPKILVILTLSFRPTAAQNVNASRRVYYGHPTEIKRYPFYAGLSNCGSVILSHFWIMTAAHCMNDPDRKHGFIWVGGDNVTNSIRIPYHEVMVHPGYKDIHGIQINDLALIKLDTPLQYSAQIQPARLPFYDTHIKDLVLVSRGSDEVNTPQRFRELKKVDLIRLSRQECMQKMRPYYAYLAWQNVDWLEKIHICVTRAGGVPSVCKGDSGSPLVSGDVVMGVHSFGSETCEDGKLGFFTNVHYYLPWIRYNTGL